MEEQRKAEGLETDAACKKVLSNKDKLLKEASFTLTEKSDKPGATSGTWPTYKAVVLEEEETWQAFREYMVRHQDGTLYNPFIDDCCKDINNEFNHEAKVPKKWSNILNIIKRYRYFRPKSHNCLLPDSCMRG